MIAPDLKLSTGRTVKHALQPNGSQLATPTPGPEEMTPEEWGEYCDLIARGPAAKPARIGCSTPWGVSDHQETVMPGLVFHSTPSHGGYGLEPRLNALVLQRFPGFRTFCGQAGWYEEDCDWAAVALTFPQCFPAETVKHAEDMRPYLVKRCQG